MAVSTHTEIRDLHISLIAAITPSSQSGVRFRPHRERKSIDEFGDENPNAVMRLFSVLDNGVYAAPAVSGLDLEWREVTLEILVGYPLSGRAGIRDGLDLEALMIQDSEKIEAAVGLSGYANFPNSVFLSDKWSTRIVDGENTRYLRIETTHGYWRNKTYVAI